MIKFIFTLREYFKYSFINEVPNFISDVSEKYELEIKDKEKEGLKNKNTGKHQYHDKVFKELLDDKEEFAHFMEKYMGYKIKKEEIEKYNRKFNTSLGFKVRESDIIYKIKGKEEFILVEHQSTVDYKEPERITEYCLAIINSRELGEKVIRKYPIIYPTVLSTAKKKWNASLTITQEKDEYYGFPELEYPKYNLVDANNYTIKELLADKTGISLAMAFEKIKTEEEIIEITKELEKTKLNKKEVKCLYLILKYSGKIEKYLGEKGKIKYEKIIMEGEEKTMENFENTFIKFLKDNYKKGKEDGVNEGISQGVKQGIKQGISQGINQGIVQKTIEIAKNLLNKNMKDEDIIEVTKISKEELEKLKLQKV